MKLLATLLLLAGTAVGAQAAVVFKAYMVTNDRPLFVVDVDGKSSDWIPLATEFHGCKLANFDPAAETLTVVHDGKSESIALKSAKVEAAPIDPNEPLRTLKGLPLAYEVARRGDENTRAVLIRYQQALSTSNNSKATQNALKFLRSQIDRLAANGAERILRGK